MRQPPRPKLPFEVLLATSAASFAACIPPSTLQEMDVGQFWDLQIEAIHAADRHSPLN